MPTNLDGMGNLDATLVRGLNPDPKYPPEVTDAEIVKVLAYADWYPEPPTHIKYEGGLRVEFEDIEAVLAALITNDLVVRVNTHPRSGCAGRTALEIVEKWREAAADAAMKMREDKEAGK